MISAVVLTKNEEKNIQECLKALSWCDEILVVDDYSEDKTVEIAEKSKSTVVKRHLEGDFASQRNFGLDKAKGDWVLFVDADERVSEELQKEILETLTDPKASGYAIPRKDFMWGSEIRFGDQPKGSTKSGLIELVRLGKKGAGTWTGKVHEVWEIADTDSLQNPILHYPHPTASEFLTEINMYSTIRAKELFDQHKTASLLDIIFYTKGKFVQNYILRGGYKDGMPGFIIALFMSFHSFLVRSKLWLLQNKAN